MSKKRTTFRFGSNFYSLQEVRQNVSSEFPLSSMRGRLLRVFTVALSQIRSELSIITDEMFNSRHVFTKKFGNTMVVKIGNSLLPSRKRNLFVFCKKCCWTKKKGVSEILAHSRIKNMFCIRSLFLTCKKHICNEFWKYLPVFVWKYCEKQRKYCVFEIVFFVFFPEKMCLILCRENHKKFVFSKALDSPYKNMFRETDCTREIRNQKFFYELKSIYRNL